MSSPTAPSRFTVPGASGASIPLTAEPDVDRTASMGTLVKDATAQVSTLVRSEIELAKLEVTESVKSGLRGGIFFAVAGVIGLFSLWFFFFMIGEILDIWLPRWAAFTIVFAIMVLAAGALGFLGYRKLKQIKKPEQTIASLNQTAETLKSAASGSTASGSVSSAAPGTAGSAASGSAASGSGATSVASGSTAAAS